MGDAEQPIPTDGRQPPVDAAAADAEQTIPPGEANTHRGSTSDQTLQPSDSAGTAEPVDRTIPPSSSGSGAAAETSAEPVHDQTLQPGGDALPADELDSNTFGDYEIIQEIARGGMGVVYKARQVSLNRTVALKKILSGQLAGEEDLKRFQVEAEASAQLDHVGIVPVYDFGQVDGQYYFSMGFVEGDDLAERIRERPLEAEAAAQMMIKIAQAVGYANAQGVIHRDLKPSNVLLDAQNEPKVTDFGVAKQQGNDSEMTAQGQILGTPSYMPPEQAAGQGDTVDQRSDVYSLGAILYALLTGRPPFQAATAMETMIQVLDQQPVPISQLNSTIPRDLETICLKCLQKEPAKRYESAEALAEDLKRYLADEPIVARPPTRTEQLGRWVRKNRATAIGTGLVAATLIVATIISISFAVDAGRQRDLAAGQRDAAKIAKEEADNQREIAEAKTEEVAQQADEMRVMVDFQTEQLSGIDVPAMGASLKAKMIEQLQLEPSSAASADFTGASLQLLDEHIFGPALVAIDQRFAEQPLVQAELLQTMATTLRDLGLLERAMAPQRRALETRVAELGRDDPATLNSINNMGVLLKKQGKYDEALPYYTEALETYRRTLGDDHPSTLASISNMGTLLESQGKYDEALPYMAEVLETSRRTLGDEHPGTLRSISNMGMLFLNQGKYDEALPYVSEALEARRRALGDEHPSTLMSINNMGVLLKKQGKYDEALPYYTEALETYRRTLGDDHPSTLASINNMGVLLESQGKYDEALPYMAEVLEARRRALGDEHPDTLMSINNMGVLLKKQGKYDEALPYYTEALETYRRTLGDEHPSTLRSINNMGVLLSNQGKYDEALPYVSEALEAKRRTLGDDHPDTLASINNMGNLLSTQGKYDEALPYMAEVLEVSRRTLGDEHPGTLRSISNMGMLFLNQGKYDEALPYFSEALEVSRRTLGDEHPNTLTSISNMGNLLNSQGKYDEALPHFTEALEAYRRTLGDEHPSTQQTQRGLNATLAALKAADENKDENKSDDKEADDKKLDDKKEDKQPDDQQSDNQQPDKRSSGGADSPLDSLSPGLNEIQIDHDGQSRRLLITTPKSLAAGRSYPVLFCFHGAGGKADGQSKRWSRHADPRNLVVVSCEAVQPMAKWNFMDQFHAVDHDDVGLVTGVVQGLIAAGVADPRSIYATGHSSGGLFCYRLAKQTDLFAAFAPMSCGMVKGAHTPADPTRPVSILQVIGDQDKSFHGSTNPKVTMYSAAQRIDLWRTFNGCAAQPVIAKRGEEVTLSTYANEGGIEVVLCEVKGEGHHLRGDLRDETDAIALDFLLKHRREQKPVQGPGSPRSE